MGRQANEDVIREDDFPQMLADAAEMFFRLADTLVRHEGHRWGRRHYFQLITEADTAEAFLDDHGARYNRCFSYLTELTASVRGFAIAGLRISHLVNRIDAYLEHLELTDEGLADLRSSIQRAASFIQSTAVVLLRAILEESKSVGVELPAEGFPSSRYETNPIPRRLPRNVDHEDLEDEEQRIAEVASKFVQSCEMLRELGVRRIEDPSEREQFLRRVCKEESARVYQATVHNLQSAYDTYIKNTVLEANDERLPRLRAYASASLHFLEAVTVLTHFVDRHEGIRSDSTARRIEQMVERATVRDVTLNHLLYWACDFMNSGCRTAEDLLPSYTNVKELTVQIGDDVVLHARPASLIVGIVNNYGTPVEMEVEGESCNAGSMLSLMVAIGSNPESKTFTFRGDENPLRDIGLLFECGLGESGMEELPDDLAYLRRS